MNTNREGLLPPNGTVTSLSLATALTRLNVAHIPKQVFNIINATAMLLSTTGEAQDPLPLANKIDTMIAPAIERLNEIADDIKCVTTQLLTEAQTNTNILDEIREETQVLQNL